MLIRHLFFLIAFAVVFLDFNTFTDAPQEWQYGFQDPACPVMEGIISLHHQVFFIATVVVFFVSWLLVVVLYFDGFLFSAVTGKVYSTLARAEIQSNTFNFIASKLTIYNNITKKIRHAATLEFIWTVVPALVLITIVVPSFILLYSMDEIIEPCLSLKVEGHQWYWAYSLPEFNTAYYLSNSSNVSAIEFDSYMVPDEDIGKGQLRLLETDTAVYLPTNLNVRVLVSASDVLHSWAIPSLGIKIDAVPGRINQVSLFIKRSGIYYGQCSELCGVNHGFMPITIEASLYKNFVIWLNLCNSLQGADNLHTTTEFFCKFFEEKLVVESLKDGYVHKELLAEVVELPVPDKENFDIYDLAPGETYIIENFERSRLGETISYLTEKFKQDTLAFKKILLAEAKTALAEAKAAALVANTDVSAFTNNSLAVLLEAEAALIEAEAVLSESTKIEDLFAAKAALVGTYSAAATLIEVEEVVSETYGMAETLADVEAAMAKISSAAASSVEAEVVVSATNGLADTPVSTEVSLADEKAVLAGNAKVGI